MMPHQQLKELVQKEMKYESSSSSSSASLVCLLHPQTSPTTSIHTNNICCFNHNPPYHNILSEIFGFRARKLKHSSFSHATRTWERLKALCSAHLPTMDAHAPLEIVSFLRVQCLDIYVWWKGESFFLCGPLFFSEKEQVWRAAKEGGARKRGEIRPYICCIFCRQDLNLILEFGHTKTKVSVLHKMLAHEQKVHEYLERLHHRQDGSALSIPNFLPPKVSFLILH